MSARTLLAGLSLPALLLISPEALAERSSQVLVGASVAWTFGADSAPGHLGWGLEGQWQSVPAGTYMQSELARSAGAFAQVSRLRRDYWRLAAGGRAGLVRLSVDDSIASIASGHTPGASGEADLGLAVTSRGALGLHLGAGGQLSYGAARFAATAPLARWGEGSGWDPTVSAGLLLPTLEMTNQDFGEAVAGRPLRVGGRPRLGALRVVGDGRCLRDARVARWVRDGRTEAASVPAFVRLSRQLRALGAPRGLIRGALAAAADEALHAALCFSLAGRAASDLGAPARFQPLPLPLPARRPAPGPALLAEVAAESWQDGVIGEGRAAADAAHEARRTDDPVTRAVLERIAVDEARHAALAADVLRWAQREGAVIRA
jgi:hypothetical protein